MNKNTGQFLLSIDQGRVLVWRLQRRLAGLDLVRDGLCLSLCQEAQVSHLFFLLISRSPNNLLITVCPGVGLPTREEYATFCALKESVSCISL